VYVCVLVCGCPWRPEEGIRSPEAGVGYKNKKQKKNLFAFWSFPLPVGPTIFIGKTNLFLYKMEESIKELRVDIH